MQRHNLLSKAESDTVVISSTDRSTGIHDGRYSFHYDPSQYVRFPPSPYPEAEISKNFLLWKHHFQRYATAAFQLIFFFFWAALGIVFGISFVVWIKAYTARNIYADIARAASIFMIPTVLVLVFAFLIPYTGINPSSITDWETPIVFRWSTRGTNPHLVRHTVQESFLACKKFGNFSLEVATDNPIDIQRHTVVTGPYYRELLIPADFLCLNGSKFKARGLHYGALASQAPPNAYIVHLDEESIVTEEFFLGVREFVSKNYGYIGQGIITYAREAPDLEHQLQERLRWRDDLDQKSFAFLQKGENHRNRQGDFIKLAARNHEINNYYWPEWQEETFAECAAELEQTHCFHIENWEKASNEQEFGLTLLKEDNQDLAASLLEEHLTCGTELQSGLYKSLFRRYTSSLDQQMQHDAIVEISRVCHWDSIRSFETLEAVVTGEEDGFFGSKELNRKFILALCNTEDKGPKAFEKDIKRMIRPAKHLCVTLDYLLTTSSRPLDCLNYWDSHLTKAKKSGTTAAIKLVPIVWKFLIENIPGLDLETILSMDIDEDVVVTAKLDLERLLNSYSTVDPDSKLWSTVYKGDSWVLGKKRNKNRWSITTSTFVKALLKHIGINASVVQNNPSKRKRDDSTVGSWNITIHSSIRNLCIISCIFSTMHWGNFHLISAGIEKAMVGQRNSILLYKEHIIDQHFNPKGKDESHSDQECSTLNNTSQISLGLEEEEDRTNSQHFHQFMIE